MASSPCRELTTTSPYRTAERPPPEPRPEAPFDMAGMAVFVWVVTLARVVLGAVHAEPPDRELAVAWLVLISLPILLGRARARRRKQEI
jgi:hypothetical protein